MNTYKRYRYPARSSIMPSALPPVHFELSRYQVVCCQSGVTVSYETNRQWCLTIEQIRYTGVDLIVHLIGYSGWVSLQKQLRQHGFIEKMDEEDDTICSMFLGDLRVHFMPDNQGTLGFSNIWYPQTKP